MKITVFQPPYPEPGSARSAETCIGWMRSELGSLVAGEQDLILLPEYSTAPGLEDRKLLRQLAQSQGDAFLRDIAGHAKRLHSLIALSGPVASGEHWYNRTLVFDTAGDLAFTYDKVHLTDVEKDVLDLMPGSGVQVLDRNGIRYGFATCFDLYFPEHFEALASQNVDVVLCPSYQRSESAERIRLIAQTRALDCGTYLIRSSYSVGDALTAGRSLVATPEGDLLVDAGDEACVIHAELDPKRKFVKPASHGRPVLEHRELIESHRRPGTYRASVKRTQQLEASPFPHLCAHRGLSLACPENTIPAFAAVIAAGAHEIEFDVKWSRDRVPVICHDPTLDRTTDGTGPVTELDWADLHQLDAGSYLSPEWASVRIPRLEEVLDLAGGRVRLNIHTFPDGDLVRHICDLLRERSLIDTAYLALGTEEALAAARDYAPEISRACLAYQKEPDRMIAAAVDYSCERVQLFRQITADEVGRAHKEGLICNLFWSDEPDDAREYVRKGIDVILTNATHTLTAGGFSGLAASTSV